MMDHRSSHKTGIFFQLELTNTIHLEQELKELEK